MHLAGVEVHVAERARLPWGVDSHTPTDTRLYDYALGGKDNYAVDRVMAHRLLSVAPEARHIAAENNRFARRAVRHLLAAGVRQFLDIGCGLPRRGNVHDLAGPGSRVIYVDYDPVAVTHYAAMLSDRSPAAVIHADARHPARILRDPVVTDLIDFDRPVALRGREAIAGLFDGFELLDPGLVPAPGWRPDRPYRTPSGWLLSGVGRTPIS